MGRISFTLLTVTSLVLTVYFGAAAWRLSDDGRDISQTAAVLRGGSEPSPSR
jgi:hypothetical protein